MPRSQPISKSKEIYLITNRIILQIWRNGSPDPAVANRLRTATSINDRDAMLVWPYIFQNFDKQDLSNTRQPTHQETAIFTALHTWSIYQHSTSKLLHRISTKENQSHPFDRKFMHVINNLRNSSNQTKAFDRRVQPILNATDINTVTNSLFRLIEIVKAQSSTLYPIDFSSMAVDLYQLQNPYQKDNIILNWGRQYFSSPAQTGKSTENQNNQSN